MDKKRILLYKMRLNPETGQWERISSDEEFFPLTPHTLAALYAQAHNSMDEMRHQIIEEALGQSDWHESEEILAHIKNKK